MQLIVIACGGKATKCAEAMVKLLTVGFPTHRDPTTKLLTSSGDKLQFWRIDSDRSSGAGKMLKKSMETYQELQQKIGAIQGTLATSLWSMDLDTQIRHLDPLQLYKTKNLKGVFDSSNGTDHSNSKSPLNLFYEPKDLNIIVDRGFYQKPFIGAPIMGLYTKSLKNQNTTGGAQIDFNTLAGQEVRFLLFISLDGATGASSFPTMVKFLDETRKQRNSSWHIGACLLTPYCIPKQPPFNRLPEGQEITPEIIEDHYNTYKRHDCFKGRNESEQRELVKQILQGFYANPEEMLPRALQGFAYCQDHVLQHLDEIYLVGKATPDELPFWSNGGENQDNPLNSAEIVAALSGLNFFSKPRVNTGTSATQYVSTSSADLIPNKIKLSNLPRYTTRSDEKIEAENVILSSAAMYHFLLHQIPWADPAKKWHGIDPLREVYKNDETLKESDFRIYHRAAEIIRDTIISICSSNPSKSLGWDSVTQSQLSTTFFSSDKNAIKKIVENTKPGWFSDQATGELVLEKTSIKASTSEFGEWCPKNFTTGHYMRFIWSKLYDKALKYVEQGASKILLNDGFLGANIGVLDERSFAIVDNIPTLPYKADYFEATPTAWAGAYGFKKSLEQAHEKEKLEKKNNQRHAASQVTEEWVSLFLLHYAGIIHLESYNQRRLTEEFGDNLWQALSGTYPNPDGETLQNLVLLKASDGTVIGGQYPEIIFFPGRGRIGWKDNQVLSPYLKDNKLSWQKCFASILPTQQDKNDFNWYLRNIAQQVLKATFKEAINLFCDQVFGEVPKKQQENFSSDPAGWPTLAANFLKTPKLCLDVYPLRQKRKNGYTYYLVSGLPEKLSWMTTPIKPGMPAPVQYKKSEISARTLLVEFAGTTAQEIPLGENDEIVQLETLFLSAPYWSKKPATLLSKNLHEVLADSSRDLFSSLNSTDQVVLLAPIKREFLEYFYEFLQRPETEVRVSGSSIIWRFTLLGKEIIWRLNPNTIENRNPQREAIFAKALSNSNLSLWPPRLSSHWNLYIAHGYGAAKDKCGRWSLISEKGVKGKNIDLGEDTYISVLHSPTGEVRPKGLLLQDSSGSESGILFLKQLDEQTIKGLEVASLAVDFGTSNTCLAYKEKESSPPENLIFSLSPLVLWGEALTDEILGVIPFNWAKEKGFYPTIVAIRKVINLENLPSDNVELEHLMQSDIPMLHKGLGPTILQSSSTLSKNWHIFPSLKWGSTIPIPTARNIFLQLILLYAHAELFFVHGVSIKSYVFTFPLAFPDHERENFHRSVRKAITKVRSLCYGAEKASQYVYISNIDESTAIGKSEWAVGHAGVIDLFIDVGGGTADIAIRYKDKFLVLDSIKLAGEAFFRFTQENFDIPSLKGNSKFISHLQNLLLKGGQLKGLTLSLSTSYSVLINGLDNETFTERERKILEERMDRPSFQWYRSLLFFQHIITYALIQACATAIDNQIMLPNNQSPGIQLILSGNGWGLMPFAEWLRSTRTLTDKTQLLLDLLKKRLVKSTTSDKIVYINNLEITNALLLNERDVSKAKTAVAKGALVNLGQTGQLGETKPYTGLTLKKLQINDLTPIPVYWHDRWSLETIKKKSNTDQIFGDAPDISLIVEENHSTPIDDLLSIFTCVGYTKDYSKDHMEGNDWMVVNGLLQQGGQVYTDFHRNCSPIGYFISKILYPEDDQHIILNKLAEKDGHR